MPRRTARPLVLVALLTACGDMPPIDGLDGEEGMAAVVAPAGGMPVALAVDATHVYWATLGPGGTLLRAPKAGGEAQVLARELGFPQPRIAVDDRNVYVIGAPEGLLKVPKDGSGPAAALAADVVDVTTDGALVYWSTGPAISRAPSTSGPPSTVIEGVAAADVLAVDATQVYWVDRFQGELHRAGLNGEGGEVRLDTILGDSGPTLTLDDEAVYWGVNGYLSKVAKADGTVTLLAPEYGSFGPAWSDGAHIYSFRPGDEATPGAILRLAVTGGAIVPLLEGDDLHPYALALDEAFVYWGDAGTIQRTRK